MFKTIKVTTETVNTFKGEMEKVTVSARNENSDYQLYAEVKRYKNDNRGWFGFLEAGRDDADYGWDVHEVICPSEDELDSWECINDLEARDFVKSLAAQLIERRVNQAVWDFAYAGTREYLHLAADILTDSLYY